MAASRVTVHFPCPVERVWQTVTDLMNTAWRGDLARVEILNEPILWNTPKAAMPRILPFTGLRAALPLGLHHGNGSMSGTWVGIFETAEAAPG